MPSNVILHAVKGLHRTSKFDSLSSRQELYCSSKSETRALKRRKIHNTMVNPFQKLTNEKTAKFCHTSTVVFV